MTRAKSQVEEQCEHADPASPVEHFIVCPSCGQIFDCREPNLVRHHAQHEHAPILSPAT